MLKRIPGQLKQQPVDEEETFLRQNFNQSENRNFRDGDIASSRKYTEQGAKSPEELNQAYPGSTAMYDAPQTPRVSLDEEGNKIRKKDKSSKRTSLITDEVRVYKGGSWKDRAYWLDPAQRRFYHSTSLQTILVSAAL